MTKKVMVAMSGGVDSSVAAALLLDQGLTVVGATFKLYGNDVLGNAEQSRTCCSLDDVADARSVANRLGFDHYVLNFGAQFQQEVIRRFAESYSNGETPNPCIDCNRYIKFSKLLERAQMLDFDGIATGHYAQVDYDEASGRYLLKKAADPTKDQTYVLYALTQQELARVIFPLGSLHKSEVRSLAEKRNLVNARKPDSQDICFVPNGDYAGFLKNILGIQSAPGPFVDRSGTVLGMHQGLIHYTIGQRKGLKLSFDQPRYVIKKDRLTNTVTLGEESDLFASEITVGGLNWISIEKLTEPIQASVKIRYSHKETLAMLYPLPENRVRIQLNQPQRAVTAGQAAVFYQGDIVVGGGTIEI